MKIELRLIVAWSLIAISPFLAVYISGNCFLVILPCILTRPFSFASSVEAICDFMYIYCSGGI